MKPNDLRMGNLVYNRHNEVTEVDLSDLKQMCQPRMDGHGYSGIPLTSQWLEKMGYKEDHHNYYIGSIIALSVHARYYSGILYLQVLNGMYLGDRVKFVHEYQNLYHALTGNELEMKP
jgi:hypothetical protein